MQNLGICIGFAAIAFGLCSVAAGIRYVGNRIKQFNVDFNLNEDIKNKELIKEVANELSELSEIEENTKI